MPESTPAFFDPSTMTMLREVLEDAWSRLPAGQTSVSRSMLAERILEAARAGERNPKQTPPAWPTNRGCDSVFALIRGVGAWRGNLH
jgi:hypothetical protein